MPHLRSGSPRTTAGRSSTAVWSLTRPKRSSKPQYENTRLKTLVADLSLDKAILRGVAAKIGWPVLRDQSATGLCSPQAVVHDVALPACSRSRA